LNLSHVAQAAWPFFPTLLTNAAFSDILISRLAKLLIDEERGFIMIGDFGRFINEKRLGRASNGGDILLKDIAQAMGTTATYLSDIIKGRRNPPEMGMLLKIADVLQLTEEERAEMFDLAGRERNEAAPDLPEYIMDENIPHVRAALRKASNKKLGDDFWQRVLEEIEKKG
jgi:transcriptional regulator with XRE-family HTH domain